MHWGRFDMWVKCLCKSRKVYKCILTEELRINMNFSWWTCSSSSSRELYSWGNTFSLKYSQTDNPSWTLNLINFFSIHVLFLVIYILIIFSKFPYLHASLHSRSSRHVDDTSSMPMKMTAPNQRAAKWRNKCWKRVEVYACLKQHTNMRPVTSQVLSRHMHLCISNLHSMPHIMLHHKNIK